jgi:hypothetical protein
LTEKPLPDFPAAAFFFRIIGKLASHFVQKYVQNRTEKDRAIVHPKPPMTN